MVFITQLVYVNPGKESVFDDFEAVAIALIGKHGGELLLRLRPSAEGVIAGSIELPYEIHLVRFPSDQALASFMADPERQGLLHLKNDSVRSSLVVRGSACFPLKTIKLVSHRGFSRLLKLESTPAIQRCVDENASILFFQGSSGSYRSQAAAAARSTPGAAARQRRVPPSRGPGCPADQCRAVRHTSAPGPLFLQARRVGGYRLGAFGVLIQSFEAAHRFVVGDDACFLRFDE